MVVPAQIPACSFVKTGVETACIVISFGIVVSPFTIFALA